MQDLVVFNSLLMESISVSLCSHDTHKFSLCPQILQSRSMYALLVHHEMSPLDIERVQRDWNISHAANSLPVIGLFIITAILSLGQVIAREVCGKGFLFLLQDFSYNSWNVITFSMWNIFI